MITAWSYSRVKDFDICPRFAFYAHSKKSQYKELRTFGGAAERGTKIHDQGERWLKGKRKTLPDAYGYLKQDMKALREASAIAEGKWAFTPAWENCDWFAEDVWLRMAIDARVEDGEEQRVIDFKTGKIYEDHPQQLELYALATFKKFPDTNVVHVEDWYLDLGEIHDGTIYREEEKTLTKKWEGRASKMLDATEFPATPGWKCRFCDFAASKGGPCTEEKR